MMTGAFVGAALGLLVGGISYVALKALAGRVELPETRKVLGVTALIDLFAFPVAGFAIGWMMSGE